MPPQVDEFLPQQQQQNQQSQNDVERRINELSSTVDALCGEVSNLQAEVQKLTLLAEQSQQNQRVIELSSTVEELRRQLSDMQNGMQQQSARDEKESSLWREMLKHRTQQQRQQQSSGRVPDWLRQKILQERRSEIIRRELNKYESTSSSTSSASNAEEKEKSLRLAIHLLQDTSENQQKPASSSVQSDESERLQQDFPPKVSNPWAHWVSPGTIDKSEKIQAEKTKIDQASNYLCEAKPLLHSINAGLEENKHTIRQASKNSQKNKSLSMTEDEQRQFDLNLEKAMDASVAFLDGMKIWNDSLKAVGERNRTEENNNEE